MCRREKFICALYFQNRTITVLENIYSVQICNQFVKVEVESRLNEQDSALHS
jgi:hypothetical protein